MKICFRKFISFLVAVCVLVPLFSGCSAPQNETETPPRETSQAPAVTATVNCDERFNPDIKKLLEEFAFTYGTVLTTLENQDFSLFFVQDDQQVHYEKVMDDYLDFLGIYEGVAQQNKYRNQAAFDTLVAIRKMSDKNLAAESVSVTYNIESVDDSGDIVIVHITEDNTQKFSFMTRPSCSANINHWFVFRNTEEGWKIAGHIQEEDFFLLALEAWKEKTDSMTVSDKAADTVKILVADAQENIDELKISTGEEPADITVKKAEYDRDAAVAYAEKWWKERNYTGNLAYDSVGGNCQNFASQCIRAGGIKMDHSGYIRQQWKFYDRRINERWIAAGRSYSWTGVDAFYTYARHNTDGMICQADLRLEYAEKGDVIQVGAYHQWRHSLVVTDIIRDENGQFQDIVVASNTADRWNYPLSAYIYTYPRLIHIIGEN